MKVNILVPTRNGGKFASDEFLHSTLDGQQVSGPVSPEDDLIQSVDEERMSDEKVIASRFLKFLGNQRISLDTFKQLPTEERKRLLKEFIGA